MKKIKSLLIISLLSIINCQLSIAQSPSIQWAKCYGGTGYERANSISQTKDGGYIVAGLSLSNDGDVTGNHGTNGDYWIVKIDNLGTIQWEKCYGGSFLDWAYSIQQTNDGGYIIAGFTSSNDGDVMNLHLDSLGNHSDDAWIVKINDTGAVQWAKCYGGSSEDYANSIQQTFDGGYIFAGYTRSNDGDVIGNQAFQNSWVVKLNDTGAIEWSKCYGAILGQTQANSIVQTSDSGYIYTGYASTNGLDDGDVTGSYGDMDFWVVRLDKLGTLKWEKCYGGGGSDEANSIINTYDGGYAVTGYTGSFGHGYLDYMVVKLSDTGAVQWQQYYGGTNQDYANSIVQTLDSGYVIAGDTWSVDGDVTRQSILDSSITYWVIKLDKTGSLIWNDCLPNIGNFNGGGEAYSIIQTTDGGYAIAGESGATTANYWIYKLAPDTATGIDEIKASGGVSVYPNPACTFITVKSEELRVKNEEFRVMDVFGRVIHTELLTKPSTEIDVREWSAGVYFYEVRNEQENHRGKIIKE